MSLQLAAQHLSNQGRGPDTTLVHMSNRELKSLSDLAQAHGRQLTINPHTGLPEAGVLDRLLPTIVGAGLTYFSGGAINPMTAGFITGGLETLRSGSLEKGLMAGLGAYGGAGLTSGLMGAGAAEIGMSARDAAVKSATEQGLTGEAYNKAIQDQVTQQMAEKATAAGSISEGASQLFKEPGKVMDAMGGGWNTAKYAAGAAAPYLADAFKPTTDMPTPNKPVEYRQYKVKRRPDLSYEYEALPVSTTYTPNFAEGGGVNDMLTPYIDPSFKFKNVSGPPKVTTSTDMPELKMAAGGRTTPEEFYQKYMQGGQEENTPYELQYGTRGYADTGSTPTNTNPYERTSPTPADIVGVDGEAYTWDAGQGKYVAKPKAAEKTAPKTLPQLTQATGGDPNGPAKQAAAFDAMTPQQKADHAETMAKINQVMTDLAPLSIINKVLNPNKDAEAPKTINQALDANAETLAPISLKMHQMKDAIDNLAIPLAILNNKLNPRKGDPAPVEDKSTLSDAAQAEADAGEAEGTVTVGPLSPADGDADGSTGVGDGEGGDGGQGGDGGGQGGDGGGQGVSGGGGGTSGLGGDGGLGIGGDGGLGIGGDGGIGIGGDGGIGIGGDGGVGGIGGDGGVGGIGGDGGGVGGIGGGGGGGGGGNGMGIGAAGGVSAAGVGAAGYATGGISHAYNLGSYSDGGRLLRGPGDGVSDSIPAMIGKKQPARLADGEFVVPARIVSEIGNGSTEAGARKLYAMMDRIQRARAQTVGKGKVAKNTRAEKYLPA